MIYFNTLLLLLFSLVVLAQTESSDYGQKKLEGIMGETKIEEFPENLSSFDSLKLPKQIADTVVFSGKEVLNDSLKTKFNVSDIQLIKVDSTSADQLKHQVKTISLDTLNNQNLFKENAFLQEALNIPIDSTTSLKLTQKIKSTSIDSLNNQSFIKESEWLSDVREFDQLRDIPKDSLGGHVKNELSERGEQYLKNTGEYKTLTGMENSEGFASLQEYQQKMEEIQQQLQEAEARDVLKQKLSTQGKQFVSEHMEQIKQVQEQMGKMKQKYSEIANSEDMSTAVKRTSLEGESFWKRLVLGGNFNVTRTNPLQIDFSPVIGYRFNKLFEAGFTAAYRTEFKAIKTHISRSKEEVFGYSIFASHMVFKNFFGYLEAEQLRKEGTFFEISKVNWHQTFLIGIGKKFHLTSWLDMQSMVVVNVLHDNKDGIYNSPVQFKTGFRKRN